MGRGLHTFGAPPLSGYVRLATAEDAENIAPNLRTADRKECLAAIGAPPEEVLPASIGDALIALSAVTHSGELVALFGVHPVPGMGDVGAVWFVATPAIEKHSRSFLRVSRLWVDALHSVRPVLINVADARNTLHLRWIEWSGFTFLSRITIRQVPFIEFAKAKYI